MKYLEFKQAAKKHYKTSQCLYEKCDNSNWQIQENIFYLCGYVIEMMIKYQIFRRVDYKKNEDIKKLDNYGLTYSKDINKHNIGSLVRILQKYENATILNEAIKLFKEWDVAIRYNGKKRDYSNLEELIGLSKKLIEEFEG